MATPLSAPARRAVLVVVDVVLLALAWVLAYLFRHDFSIPSYESTPAYGYVEQMRLLLVWVVGTHVLLYYGFRCYEGIARYVGMAEARAMVLATAIHAAFWVAFNSYIQTRTSFFDLPLLHIADPASHVMRVPFGVLGMYFFISLCLTGGFRFSRRLWIESQSASVESSAPATLVVGAGDVAETALRDMRRSPQARFRPVCAVAASPNRVGTTLHGIPVRGRIDRIPELLREYAIGAVLIALDEDDPALRREVVRHCQDARVQFHIVPAMRDIADGRVDVRPVRGVRIEDLLGREPVRLALPEAENYLRDRVVLITGAGGSIGSELARQALACGPRVLLLLGKGEHSIHEVREELAPRAGQTTLIPVIADVRDQAAMDALFARHRPDVVFHAAAHKHVDLMEDHPEEAVKNNVVGTAVLAWMAHQHKAGRFVLVSSDKAVRPAGIMGATKRLAEQTIFSLAPRSETVFQAVRFGNVLGSRGSALRTFERQIAAGGPVTITHPEATRYFMTVAEAVSLVLQAGRRSDTGLLFLLDMGEPVRVVDLVRQMLALSGLREGTDMEIQFTGLRPGEKIREELLTAEEGAQSASIDKVWFVAARNVPDWQATQQLLGDLRELAETGDRPALLDRLRQALPDFQPSVRAEDDQAEKPRVAIVRVADQPDLFATQEPEQPAAPEPVAPSGEVAPAVEEAPLVLDAVPSSAAVPALALAGIEGSATPPPEDEIFPSVEIRQPEFPADAPELPVGRLPEPTPEPEPESVEDAGDTLQPDMLSQLQGEEPPQQGSHHITSGEEPMTGSSPAGTATTIVFYANLDGVGARERDEFLAHLADVAGPASSLILYGVPDAGVAPAAWSNRVQTLTGTLDSPAARWNAALAACPAGSILCSVAANLRFAPGFAQALREALTRDSQAVLAYASHIIRTGAKEETVIVHDHDGCPHERFEFGPVMAYKVDAIRAVGCFDASLKHAWEYDAHLRLMDDGIFVRLVEPLVTVVQPESDEATKSGALYSPGKGPLGGFSYVFYPADMDAEVTASFEKALKRWGAWIDHATVSVPQPKTKPEVLASVVIPVLNRRRFIGNAIGKVLEGTFSDFEVIVIDNGSTDGTIEVVKQMAAEDPRVRLIHGKGSSIASALNEGIKAARGKYICQLDSDDQYAPTTLEKMVSHMESHPKCGLAISYYRLMDENAVVIEDVAPITHSGYSRNQILRRDGAGALRVFPKAVLEEFGYYDEEHYGNFGEDYDMVLKTGEKYDVDRVHDVLYYYRRHGDNTDVIRDPEMKYKNKNRARQEALRRRIAINRSR
ncbi:MAG: SDR family NAD(P)-dependent oxidoreductase [Candidatus Sumerlaeia bacterium]|nr:SDR family NAD(P)-dependent oxidoreductase [Candidatus Sumerlaeia bacterium]